MYHFNKLSNKPQTLDIQKRTSIRKIQYWLRKNEYYKRNNAKM